MDRLGHLGDLPDRGVVDSMPGKQGLGRAENAIWGPAFRIDAVGQTHGGPIRRVTFFAFLYQDMPEFTNAFHTFG